MKRKMLRTHFIQCLILLLCAGLCLGLLLHPAALAAGGGGYSYAYISFDANGGGGWMDSLYLSDETWTVPVSEFTNPSGRTFSGWGLEPAGPVVYRPGDLAYNDGSATLYAIWADMTADQLAALYTPQGVYTNSWDVGSAIDEQTGVIYATVTLRWSAMQGVSDFTVGLNLGSPDGPRVPATSTALSTSDGSVTTSWSTSRGTIAMPFLADGEQQVVADGAVNGLLNGDVVFATLTAQLPGGACPGSPVFFTCKRPNISDFDDDVDWFVESGSGTVTRGSYTTTINLNDDTTLPSGGLALGNGSYHIIMNAHTLTGTLKNGYGELFVEHLSSDGKLLAAYAESPQTITFDSYGYGFEPFGSATVTIGGYGRFSYDDSLMTATVTNGAFVYDQQAQACGSYVNANTLAVYEAAELGQDELAAYTPKNVTVTPMEDGLIVECDYEPEAHVININVDVLLSDGSSARVKDIGSHSSGKDQVMVLEGERQPFFVGTRILEDEEEQEISEDGQQKYVNGFRGGDRISVTMNFEVGPHFQKTPWSAPPVSFVYSSSAIGKTFDANGAVERNFLPDIATVTVSSPLELTYNGTYQTLEYALTLADGTPLTPGVDYIEEYTNNYMPGEASLAVIGISPYSGRMTQPFTIAGIDLESDAVTVALAYESAVYTGNDQEPAVAVFHDGRLMSESSEYSVNYSDNVDAGTATVTITPGYNNVTTGTRTEEFTIEPRSMESDALYVTLSQNRFAWTGEPAEPALTSVVWGDTALTEGTDFTLSYVNNVDAGTASAVLTGMGNYEGARNVDFAIYNPVSLASKAAIDPIAPVIYDGSAQTPGVTVRVGDAVLRAGWDYTVAYSDNVAAGTATVTVTGRRDYVDSLTATFAIDPADLAVCAMTLGKPTGWYGSTEEAVYTYSGGQNKPQATLTFGGKTLVEGASYTLSFENNVEAGTATAVATGMGNFAGTKRADFTILPCDLNDLNASVATVTYSGKAQTPRITMYTSYEDDDGHSRYNYLAEGADYAIRSWADNVNAGPVTTDSWGGVSVTPSATVTVAGAGNNYTGTRTIEFTIKPLTMYREDFAVTYDRVATYTGQPVNPIRSVVRRQTGETLVEGRDYTVTYQNYNDVPDNDDNGNHTDICGGIEARLAFTGNFSGSGYNYSFDIAAAPGAFAGAAGRYYGTDWSVDVDGTLTVAADGALADLSYHNDVAWRPYRDHIRKIVVAQGVTALTAGAFDGCRYATEAVLPEGLTTVYYNAFTGCDSLLTLNVPSTVTLFSQSALPANERLTVDLPDNITDFDGYGALANVKGLVTPGSVTEATLRARQGYFYYKGYPDFQLYDSDGVLWLYKYTGDGGTVTVPDFVESMRQSYGLSSTNRIEKVVVPGSVADISTAFEYCYGLREVVIQPGSKLTSLGSYTFYGCDELTVRVPDNVIDGGSNAFTSGGNVLIVANCDATIIEWAKGQMSYGSRLWIEEDGTSGKRYRLTHRNALSHEGRAPTCEQDGWTDYVTCSACEYDSRVELPALGHSWGDVHYTWSDDMTRVTATRACKRDASHTQTETVSVFASITPSTCLTGGHAVYTSDVFANPAFRVQSVAVELPVSGHTPVHSPSTAATSACDGVRGGAVCGVCGETLQEARAVSGQKLLSIPAMMKTIEAEAFRGIAAEQVVIPSGATYIGNGAFADCERLLLVVIPASVKTIEGDPFAGSDVAVICPDGSAAARWCDGHGVPHNPQ